MRYKNNFSKIKKMTERLCKQLLVKKPSSFPPEELVFLIIDK